MNTPSDIHPLVSHHRPDRSRGQPGHDGDPARGDERADAPQLAPQPAPVARPADHAVDGIGLGHPVAPTGPPGQAQGEALGLDEAEAAVLPAMGDRLLPGSQPSRCGKSASTTTRAAVTACSAPGLCTKAQGARRLALVTQWSVAAQDRQQPTPLFARTLSLPLRAGESMTTYHPTMIHHSMIFEADPSWPVERVGGQGSAARD
jgi:hypothetical protein